MLYEPALEQKKIEFFCQDRKRKQAMDAQATMTMNIDDERVARDRVIVTQILETLSNSTLSAELQEYRHAIAKTLKLDYETMERVFSFESFAYFTRPQPLRSPPPPQRFLGGRPLEDYNDSLVCDETRERQAHQLIRIPSEEREVGSDAEDELPRFSKERQLSEDYKLAVALQAEKQADKNEQNEQADSESESHTPNKKNRNPAAKALRKLLRGAKVPRKGMIFDTDTYEKAVLLFGETKPHRKELKDLGGSWNGKLKAWCFSKAKIIEKIKESDQDVSE